jgi:hypothetical protein
MRQRKWKLAVHEEREPLLEDPVTLRPVPRTQSWNSLFNFMLLLRRSDDTAAAANSASNAAEIAQAPVSLRALFEGALGGLVEGFGLVHVPLSPAPANVTGHRNAHLSDQR